MVSFDDNESLLRIVRQRFITGDDSQFIELLLGCPDPEYSVLDVSRETYCQPIIDTEAENFLRLSPEFPFVDCDDPLERLLYSSASDEISETGTKTKMKPKSKTLTAEEVDKYFPVKPSPTLSPSSPSPREQKTSNLTLALEQAQADGRLLRNSLFSDYAIYDGRSGDQPTRSFTVWFWRVSGFPQTSIVVQPNLKTTVREFVGLTFWQYFNEMSPTELEALPLKELERFDKNFVDHISVRMFASPTDLEDLCFSAFTPSDPIHKYGFDAVAFEEHASPTEAPLVLVTVHLPQGTSRYRFHLNTPLSAVLEHAARRRHLRQLGGYQYHLESWPASTEQSEFSSLKPGQKLDLTLKLSDVMSAGLPLRFIIVRENSRCDPGLVDSSDEEGSPGTRYSTAARASSVQCDAALRLRQYSVTLLKGPCARDVNLSVSSDGIKVEQYNSSRRRKLFSKFKPITYGIHSLADCVVETPASNANAESSSLRKTGDSSSSEPVSGSSFVSNKVHLKIICMDRLEPLNAESNPAGFGTNRFSPPGYTTYPEAAPVFQQLLFETQWSRARAICDQLNLILECSGSRARQLYMKQRLAL